MTVTTADFPVIDFSDFEANKDAVAAEIFEAASKWGFLVLKGHGIPSEDIKSMFGTLRSQAKTFFKQPKALKEEKWMNTQQIGYDMKSSFFGIQEGFCFGSIQDTNLTHPNLSSWWDQQKRFQAEDFRAKCQNLAFRLLTAFAIAMGLPENYFVDAHESTKEPGNVLRLIRYPASDTPPDASTPRLGEHTDWGTLTLLFTESPGLEVSPPNDDGTWVMAPVVEDAVIVNIADGMAMWSGKTLKSTKHRLSFQSLPYWMERHSMAYFVNANADAPLTLLERDGTTFKEKRMPFKATFGDYQAVRMRIIHEKFDTDGTDQELKIDPRFMRLVRDIGVAHGSGITFEGAAAEVVA